MSAAAQKVDERPNIHNDRHALTARALSRAHRQTEERMHGRHTQTGNQRFVNSSPRFTFINIFLPNRRFS